MDDEVIIDGGDVAPLGDVAPEPDAEAVLALEEEALCGRLHELDDIKRKAREEQREVHRQLGLIQARRRLARMSPSDRAALAQVVHLEGIASAEATS